MPESHLEVVGHHWLLRKKDIRKNKEIVDPMLQYVVNRVCALHKYSSHLVRASWGSMLALQG